MATTAGDIYVRSGNSGAFTAVQFVQGGWITVASQSQMVVLDESRLAEGQVIYTLDTSKLFITSKFVAFETPGYGGFINSASFAEFSWPGSGGGGDVDLSALNAFTASIQAEVDSLTAETGSYATTSSNTFVGTQEIDGVLVLATQSSIPSIIPGGLYIDTNYNLFVGSE